MPCASTPCRPKQHRTACKPSCLLPVATATGTANQGWTRYKTPAWPHKAKPMYHGERFNSISHLVGAGLALVGAVLLTVSAARLGDPWKIVSFSIYGTMLVRSEEHTSEL